MAHIGFVSTSVLESKDGIDFNEEVRKESEEVSEAERIAKEAERKPLWEQLAGKRDEKQAKFDAVRASMFAPPPGLDDEESNFLQGVEAQRLEAKERKEKWEAEELRGFALARANQTVPIAEPKKPKPKPPADGGRGDEDQRQDSRAGAPPPVVAVKIKAKRKKDKDKGKDEKRAKKKAAPTAAVGKAAPDEVGSDTKRPIDGGARAADGTAAKASVAAARKAGVAANGGGGEGDGSNNDDDDGKGLSSLLGAYESDSDDDEEFCVRWRKRGRWEPRQTPQSNPTAQQANMSAAVEEDWETAVGTLSIDKNGVDAHATVGAKSGSAESGASPKSSPKAAPPTTAPPPAAASTAQDASSGSAGAAAPAGAAAAAAAHDEDVVDTALMDALTNARDYVLKLESELVAFVTSEKDPKPPHLVLPPRSSYQRLIAYRLSARFKLQKATAAQEKEAFIAAGMDPATTNGVASPPPPAAGKDGSSISNNNHHHQQQQRVVVFVRVADSAVPAVLMSALDAEARKKEAAAAAATAAAVAATGSKGAPIKLMRRSPGDPRAPNPSQVQGNGGPEKQVKTVEDKEREYAEARARIFGTKSPPLPTPPAGAAVAAADGSSSPSSAAAAEATGAGGEGFAAEGAAAAAEGDGGATARAAAGERTAESGSPTTTKEAAAEGAAGEAPQPGGGGGTKGKALNKAERGGAALAGADGDSAAAAAPVSNGDNKDSSSSPTTTTAASTPATPPATNEAAAKKSSPAKGSSKANGGAGGGSPRGPTTPAGGGTKAGAAKSKAAGGGAAAAAGAAGKRTDREAKQAGGAVTSQGPDGTTGFGSGRGKPVPGAGGSGRGGKAGGLQGPDGADRGDYGRGAAGRGGGGRMGGGGGGGRGTRRPPVNAGEWKGQRGMQRNRMAEKSDPDFVRNYDNYRPSFAPFRQLADPGGGGGGYGGGRGGRGGRDGHGGQQAQPSPRLLHPHQQHPMMAAGVQPGHGQAPHAMMMPAGMQGQQLRGQMPGQPGVMLMQHPHQHHQTWQQQQMDPQALAAAAAAAAGGPPAAYGAPVPGHAMYAPQSYMDPAQAAAVAAATASSSGSGASTPRGQQPQQHHQPRQQQQQQPPQQQQHHHVQHPQQAAHHVQPQHMGYVQQQPQQQPQQPPPPPQQQQTQPGLLPTTPQQQAQQPQQQPQPLQTGLLQTPHMPATSMAMTGGYMTAQDYYGAQQQQPIYFQQDPNMQGMAMGYGVQQPQLPQQQAQLPQQVQHPQQQQQQQAAYVMSVPQQAHQQHQQQMQAQQTQHHQRHQGYPHHVYPVGAMQQQPIPQQHRQHHQGGGGGGRHSVRVPRAFVTRVFTIRRIIGECVLDRNEGLWREVDALEDILKEAQDQNEQLSKKLATRPVMMAPGLERTLLEAHLRLLLGKLGVTNGAEPGKGGLAGVIPGSGGVSAGERPRPHTFRDDELGKGSIRTCCAPSEGKSGSDGGLRSGGSSSAPNTPSVPLETPQDRAVFEFITTSRDGGGVEATDVSEAVSMRDKEGPRPQTGRRPGSSRSARSAPECLESGRSISVATIDTALGELRAAFEEEAQNLLEEVADLTSLLEDEAARKADGERRSRRNLPSACPAGTNGNSFGGDGGRDGPIPSSELRRFGKKLEEAVRSREHAAEVAQRLDTGNKKLPRKKRVSSVSGSLRSTGGEAAVGGGKEEGRGRGWASLHDGDGGRGHRSGRSRPSLKSGSGCLPGGADSELELASHRKTTRAPRTLTGRAGGSGGNPAEEELEGTAAAVTRQAGVWAREQGFLSSKLRGAVRLSREEEALDDERFLS
eukprot:g12962.t2